MIVIYINLILPNIPRNFKINELLEGTIESTNDSRICYILQAQCSHSLLVHGLLGWELLTPLWLEINLKILRSNCWDPRVAGSNSPWGLWSPAQI